MNLYQRRSIVAAAAMTLSLPVARYTTGYSPLIQAVAQYRLRRRRSIREGSCADLLDAAQIADTLKDRLRDDHSVRKSPLLRSPACTPCSMTVSPNGVTIWVSLPI